MLARTALRIAQIGLAVVMVAYLLYFADHARQILSFPHPLDYGEGPLLAQVNQLRAGTPIWHLYADPSASPYLIINYPPLYLLLCAGLSTFTGSALLAGRLISLLSALAAVAAITALSRPSSGGLGVAPPPPKISTATKNYAWGTLGLSLLFLTVPIVREWAALMRVDLLGISLGLWGLVALGRPGAPRRPALAGLLLLACLFTKPSLIAAPAAASLWLLVDLLRAGRTERGPQMRAILILGGTIVGGGGLLFGLLQSASGGWFATHVIAANANRWDASLAQGFWKAQLQLRWPLAAAALLSLVAHHQKNGGYFFWKRHSLSAFPPLNIPLTPALIYILFGVMTAVGVGKVGAYSNYFLELYAGIVWIVASCPQPSTIGYRPPAPGHQPSTISHRPSAIDHRPSAIGPRPPAISHRPSAIGHQPSTIGYRPPAPGHQPSAIGHQPSAISHRPSAIDHPPSAIGHQPSAIGYRLSAITTVVNIFAERLPPITPPSPPASGGGTNQCIVPPRLRGGTNQCIVPPRLRGG